MQINVFEPLQTSVQRMVLALIVDDALNWFPFIGGSGAQRASLFGESLVLEFLGTDVTLDENDNIDGTITAINIYLSDRTTLAASVSGLAGSDLSAIVEAAAAIPDPDNRPDVEDPFWGAFLSALGGPEAVNYTGSSERDVIDGTPLDDTINGKGNDDNLIASKGSDNVNGGGGKKDFWVGKELTQGITANLPDGFIAKSLTEIDTISGIENIVGTNYDDVITGDDKANEFWGCDDKDSISG